MTVGILKSDGRFRLCYVTADQDHYQSTSLGSPRNGRVNATLVMSSLAELLSTQIAEHDLPNLLDDDRL